MDDFYMPIGERVEFYRRRRGLSQQRLGILIDRSESWVSKIERGDLPLDRLSVLVKVAEALRVSPADLIRDVRILRDDGNGPRAEGAAALRHVILRTGPAHQGDVRGLEELRDDLVAVNDVWRKAQVGATLAMLPLLLAELESAAATAQRENWQTSLALLGQGYGLASTVLTRMAEHDLAWVMVDRSRAIAQQTDDPAALAHAGFRLTHVLLGAGRLDDAVAVANTALSAARPAVSSAARSLTGAIHLPLSVAAARQGDQGVAFAALREAEALTKGSDGRVDVPREVTFWTGFKPANVVLHRVSVAVDIGDAGEALRVAATVDPNAVGPSRRARYFIDVALAHSYRRADDRMVATLLEVEQFAREELHHLPLVKEMVYGALRRERGPRSAALHALAGRLSVV